MSPSERRSGLVWLVAGRVAISTVLFGSGVLIQLNAPAALPAGPFYFLIGLTYFLTAIYALGLRLADRWPWQAGAQIAIDTLLVTAFITVTGGVTSYFSLLYVLPIIAAGSLLLRRGALSVAALSALLFTTLVLLQYEGWLRSAPAWMLVPAVLPPPRVAAYLLAIDVVSFLAVGALAGSFAERLRSAGARLESASTEIANLQAFSQDVIDSLTSGLVTTDVSGRVLSFNRAAETITGRQAGAVVGRDVGEVLQLPDEVRWLLARDLEGARSRRADFPFVTGAGGKIEIGLAATHLMTPSGKLGFLITFQDITEMKRLERDARMKQRLAAVGEMAAGIAHEIRNPLASMAGSIQVLREELALSDEQAQLMDIVLRESNRLNDTIRSFLSYARPQQAAVERLDLAKIVAEAATLIRRSGDAQPTHSVEVDAPADPVWIEADEGQVRQILWNLASNGLRAMPSGGRLRLSVRAEAPSGAAIEVQDEGVGIAPDELDRIFQPFSGTFAHGSGLGLAIVHRIVSDSGGEIQVSSSPGQGTTITVRLGTPTTGRT